MSESPKPRRSLMFNLGAFFGGIARGVTAPIRKEPVPTAGDGPVVVRREVEERVVETPQGAVRLRRTVTDEIEPVDGDVNRDANGDGVATPR